MHIGYLDHEEQFEFNGRHIANKQFKKALSDYSGKHKVTILNPSILTENKLKSFLSENPLNVLHYPSPEMFRAMDYKRFNPIPLAVTGLTHSLGHDPYMQWLRMTLLSEPSDKDTLICTSLAAKDAVSKMLKSISSSEKAYKLNTSVVPLGVFTSDFAKIENEKDKDKIDLLYFGRLSALTKVDLKPLLFMIQYACARTNKKITLTIAGSGLYYAKLLKQITNNFIWNYEIKIINDVTDLEKKLLYSKADIFIAPSNNTQETFGLTLIEAAASSLPIIAYDWSGYREIVKDGENGFLIETIANFEHLNTSSIYPDYLNQVNFSNSISINKSMFVDRLLLLINDNDLRYKMSENSLSISKQYDWNTVLIKYINLWEKLHNVQGYREPKLMSLDYKDVFCHYPSRLERKE